MVRLNPMLLTDMDKKKLSRSNNNRNLSKKTGSFVNNREEILLSDV